MSNLDVAPLGTGVALQRLVGGVDRPGAHTATRVLLALRSGTAFVLRV